MDSNKSPTPCFLLVHKHGATLLLASAVVAALFGLLHPAICLIAGVCLGVWARGSLTFPKKLSAHILAIAVVGLGAGMDIAVVGRQGLSSLWVTLFSIAVTFGISVGLSLLLGTPKEIGLLLSSGTAICGGSAIAAVSSVIRARPESTAVALGCVFLLNSVALFIFPKAGLVLGLSETQFGLWSALAIHDTSSVVGAAVQYGPEALVLATSTKLVRALWIAPLGLLIAFLQKSNRSALSLLKRQWFIVAFVAMSFLFSTMPHVEPAKNAVTLISKRLLMVALLFIGTGFSLEGLKKVGIGPLIHSGLLWISVTLMSLWLVKTGWL